MQICSAGRLSQRQSQLVERSHWKLHRAAEYLHILVSNSNDGSAYTWKVLVIRWIFQEAGAGGCPLNVNESSALEAEVFDCTLVVIKTIYVDIRGVHLSRLAVVPGVGREKADAFSSAGTCQRSADGNICSGAWAA